MRRSNPLLDVCAGAYFLGMLQRRSDSPRSEQRHFTHASPDPCMNNSTCPEGKLEPTYWDRPDQYEYFKDLNILLSSTAPRSTSTPSSTNGTASSSSRSSGSVIGGAVGGTLGFLAIVGVVVFLLWRRKRRVRKQTGNDSVSSMEENKPIGELASPVSAGTGTNWSFPTRKSLKPTQPFPHIRGTSMEVLLRRRCGLIYRQR